MVKYMPKKINEEEANVQPRTSRISKVSRHAHRETRGTPPNRSRKGAVEKHRHNQRRHDQIHAMGAAMGTGMCLLPNRRENSGWISAR